MPDLDLEPHEYSVKGRREPILQRGWWIGILTFVGVVLFGAFVMRPLFQWAQPIVHSILFGGS
jgi:hypothetical protein